MVSVIVPVYNTEAYLPRCIESICAQRLTDLEIILVDDGSTDRSGAICDAYAKKDSRIAVIHKENGGLPSARNAGLEAARGEHIGFVDSDDWIEPAMLADMLSACERENADIVTSLMYLEYESGTVRNTSPIPEGVYKAEDGSIRKILRNLFYTEDYSRGGILPNLCGKLFQRDLLRKYQFEVDQRITYGEDAACTYPCLAYANRVVVMDQAYYHYCIRDSSISNTSDDRYYERITLLYHCLKNAFLGHSEYEILNAQLKHYMFNLIVTGINELFGFGFGMVLPTHFPSADMLQKSAMKKIALYGAGAVGQSYHCFFELTRAAEVAVWVDRQWEQYQRKGFPVGPVTALEGLEYDGVLIAVKAAGTAEDIKRDLIKAGIPECKIWYAPPRALLQAVGEKQLLRFKG